MHLSVKEEFGGVFVQVGYIDEASGTFEPYMPEPVEPVVTPSQPEQLPDVDINNLITQDSEETIAIEEKKKREEEEERRREEQLKREAEERLLAEQREKEQRVSNVMQNAFGGASEGNRGTAEQGEGVQGSLSGNASSGVSQGIGGWGGFSLQGRKCLDLPKPRYNSNVEAMQRAWPLRWMPVSVDNSAEKQKAHLKKAFSCQHRRTLLRYRIFCSGLENGKICFRTDAFLAKHQSHTALLPAYSRMATSRQPCR